MLLIDDIQFFSGKSRTQEEFFYTFEDLYKKWVCRPIWKKRIICSLSFLPVLWYLCLSYKNISFIKNIPQFRFSLLYLYPIKYYGFISCNTFNYLYIFSITYFLILNICSLRFFLFFLTLILLCICIKRARWNHYYGEEKKEVESVFRWCGGKR